MLSKQSYKYIVKYKIYYTATANRNPKFFKMGFLLLHCTHKSTRTGCTTASVM